MSTPIQFGDVVKALEICLWIRNNCFDTINNASILYLGFRQDVLDLQKRLKQLQASFERAVTHLATNYNQAALLKLEADELVGDFQATLEDCQRLLKKHARFNAGARLPWTMLSGIRMHSLQSPN
jgi:hypothetical protein